MADRNTNRNGCANTHKHKEIAMTMFGQPASGGGFFKPREHEGHLVLITRLVGMDRHFDSMKGAEIDRATVDLVDLDGDGELRTNVWLTHAGLVNKVDATRPTLGRIGTEKFSKGTGFTLKPYTEGPDDAKASAWLSANPNANLKPGSMEPAAPVAVGAGTAGTTSSAASEPTTRLSLNDMRTIGQTASATTTPTLSEEQEKAAYAAWQRTQGQGGFGTSEPPF